jgi:AcrR family transcriptional regulator
MGRRSSHTPEELRELILDAARSIVEKDGLAGLSARTIAKRIGYSPGTLYNVFANLNDILLHVEARLLEELDNRIVESASGSSPEERLKRLAHCYLRFTQDRPRLWNLLFEHHLPGNYVVPEWYEVRLESLINHVGAALSSQMPGLPADTVSHSARVLWAGVHGITSLATANKLANISSDTAALLIEDLLSGYLSGLTSRRVAKA